MYTYSITFSKTVFKMRNPVMAGCYNVNGLFFIISPACDSVCIESISMEFPPEEKPQNDLYF